MTIEIASGAPPTTLEGEPLDPTSLHDWLALPVQHFMDKHPEKAREELIAEACEVVAELVASCGVSWVELKPYRQLAIDALTEQMRQKFVAHDRVRRTRN